MSADSAAEIRRQRILQNANKRMNMLLGNYKYIQLSTLQLN